ncbi:MAG: amino acid ABC transporter permease [Alphaproteobacteria bacterium]|nr:amino acid ABC transporter permease [Alphaproteobacteria bacterium]
MGRAVSRRAAVEFVRSCIASPLNLALTILVALLLWQIVPPFVEWAVLDASWRGTASGDCANQEAACWVFIHARLGSIVYGTYPQAERWRVDLAALLAPLVLALMLTPWIRRAPGRGLAPILLYPVIAGFLLCGGAFGLAPVATADWGGLMLTLVIAASTITTAIPLGLLLALGRRSALPFIRFLAVAFIELVRGMPLVAVLFMAVVMLPLFMPAGVEIDKLLRALVAFALFNAAIMAEVFRGGFQAVPASQYEAAQSLGLGSGRTLLLVVLPQIVKVAIPGIVNTCISITKETTVVLIVGLVDFLAAIQAGVSDPAWLTGEHIRSTGYLFVALVFWCLCFGMSRLSRRLERRLATGRPAA